MAVATATKKRAVLALPLSFAAALLLFGLIPDVQNNRSLWWSFIGSAAILIAWTGVLFASVRQTHRALTMNVVLLKQHYLQACAQGSVLLYWGWHWREV